MTPLYTINETRAIEQHLFSTMPSFTLMQQAGAAVADYAMHLLPDKTSSLLAIAGAGNNGGDAAIAAHLLRQAGYSVQLLLCADSDTLPPDAKRAWQQWQQGGGTTLTLANVCDSTGNLHALPPATLIIDGIFGIGLTRPPQGIWQQLIEAINQHSAPALAIDVPSGLSADSGCRLGATVSAAATVTFFGGKPGLYTGDGSDVCGTVHIAPLVAPTEITQQASGYLMDCAPELTPLMRCQNSHKGSYRTLALLGGASGMLGALVLAARAAASMGSGKTLAYAAEYCPPVDWLRPDIMWRALSDFHPDAADCIAAGMGLGLSATATATIEQLLPLPQPLLLDADALTLLAQQAQTYQPLLKKRQTGTILTPHSAEAARLCGQDTTTINENRITAARTLAQQWQATIVLKGAGSIICSPDTPFIICHAGNPGLARGGSGDVLSGIIAALLCQTNANQVSNAIEFAAVAGVWLHAAAADVLAQKNGELGVDVNQLAATAAHLVGQQLAHSRE